jgi:outer membrane protein assembly factor BamB
MRVARLLSMFIVALMLGTKSFAQDHKSFAQDHLSWEDQIDFSGGMDTARSVTLSGNTAVVAGVATVRGGLDFVVRGYDVRSGAVSWTDQTAAFSGLSTEVFVTSAGSNVFAAGYTPSTVCCTDIFVRAYDARTGHVLWDDVFDKGGDDLPQGIAASPSVVAVVGYGGNATTPPFTAVDFLVRAYDAATGAVLWDDQVDNGPFEDAAWAVAIEGNRVFVAGTTSTLSGHDMILRVYEATTGALIWQLRRPGTFPLSVAASSGRIFVAGITDDLTFFLGAYSAVSGNVRWEDTTGSGFFVDVKLQGPRVVAVGPVLGNGSVVRVYDARTGVIDWEDSTTPPPGFFEIFSAVDVSNKAVYVAGGTGADFLHSEFLVRAYDLASGALILEDRSHSSSFDAGTHAAAIVAGKHRVVAVGWDSDASNPFDLNFLVRDYEVKDIEAPGLAKKK